nr:tyrosine-type recombinase/integrase [Allocatelliglobosispora scoriae]
MEFTEAWLANRRFSDHTRAAYRRDVAGFLAWAAAAGLDPLHVNFLHVNAYARDLEATADPRTGRILSQATVARKLSALHSFFDFLAKLGALQNNPVAAADRPSVNRDHSGTVGLTPAEVRALLAETASARGAVGARNHALMVLLADLGLRVSEVVNLDLDDLGVERGHRTVRFTAKGAKLRRRVLTPGCAEAVDAWLALRGSKPGPLFATETGSRLDRHAVFRLLRRYAKNAGISSWEHLSPHSLRHAFATTARAEGVPLEDVQDAMGHADPRTTRRYDRDRHNLDRDPAYTVWAARVR